MIGAFYIAVVERLLLTIWGRSDNTTFISAGVVAFALVVGVVTIWIVTNRAIAKRYVYLKLRYDGVVATNATIAEKIERTEWEKLRRSVRTEDNYKNDVSEALFNKLAQCKQTMCLEDNLNKSLALPIRGTRAVLRDQGLMEKLDAETKKEGMVFRIFFVPWRFQFFARLVIR